MKKNIQDSDLNFSSYICNCFIVFIAIIFTSKVGNNVKVSAINIIVKAHVTLFMRASFKVMLLRFRSLSVNN